MAFGACQPRWSLPTNRVWPPAQSIATVPTVANAESKYGHPGNQASLDVLPDSCCDHSQTQANVINLNYGPRTATMPYTTAVRIAATMKSMISCGANACSAT